MFDEGEDEESDTEPVNAEDEDDDEEEDDDEDDDEDNMRGGVPIPPHRPRGLVQPKRVNRQLDYNDYGKLDREEDEVDINTLDQGNNLYASRFKRRRV
jgi:hypothetical protein